MLAITTTKGTEGLIVPDPVACLSPDSSASFTISNPTSRTLGFGPYALFFDHYPSRETGRYIGMTEGSLRLSDFQPAGVVEFPAIGFIGVEPGESVPLTVIAPPETGTWTLVIATEALSEPYSELVMPIEVTPDC